MPTQLTCDWCDTSRGLSSLRLYKRMTISERHDFLSHSKPFHFSSSFVFLLALLRVPVFISELTWTLERSHRPHQCLLTSIDVQNYWTVLIVRSLCYSRYKVFKREDPSCQSNFQKRGKEGHRRRRRTIKIQLHKLSRSQASWLVTKRE